MNLSRKELERQFPNLVSEDRPAAGDSRMALGQTDGGRYLRVIYVSDSSGIFVITAYEFTDKQLKAYRRRRRNKK